MSDVVITRKLARELLDALDAHSFVADGEGMNAADEILKVRSRLFAVMHPADEWLPQPAPILTHTLMSVDAEREEWRAIFLEMTAWRGLTHG